MFSFWIVWWCLEVVLALIWALLVGVGFAVFICFLFCSVLFHFVWLVLDVLLVGWLARGTGLGRVVRCCFFCKLPLCLCWWCGRFALALLMGLRERCEL